MIDERRAKAIKYSRFFLSDTPELNMLLQGYETSDEKLNFCIDMAVSDWNTSAPVLAPPVSLDGYPSLYLLMHGVAIVALKSAGLFQTRNGLPYQAGNSQFQRFGKGAEYQGWIRLFQMEYEQKKRDIKIAFNISRGWGGNNGVFSEYYNIGWL